MAVVSTTFEDPNPCLRHSVSLWSDTWNDYGLRNAAFDLHPLRCDVRFGGVVSLQTEQYSRCCKLVYGCTLVERRALVQSNYDHTLKL